MTETSIKAAIMKCLSKEGHFWRVGSGPYQVSGCPDILGVYHGWMIGIEVKTPEAYKKKDHGCTANQIHFMNRMEDNGALVKVVCSVEQVMEFLTMLKMTLSESSQSES